MAKKQTKSKSDCAVQDNKDCVRSCDGNCLARDNIRTESTDGVLKVIECRPEGSKLFVVVEGKDITRLMSSEARSLAFDQRMKYGMGNAGIESRGGTFIDPSELQRAADEDTPVNTWRSEFVITQMI